MDNSRHMKITFFRRREVGKQSSKHLAKWTRALRGPIETLERRMMLSISTASWFDPYLETGAHWTVQESDTTGQAAPVTYNFVTKGPTTYQGTPVIEIDSSVPSGNAAGLSSTLYEGKDSSGDYVQYAGNLTIPGATVSDVYTPYAVDQPAEMTAGVAATFSHTDVQTTINKSGTNTTTDVETDSYTLQSETPTTITVLAGTYQAYEVLEVMSYNNSDGSTTSPTTQDAFFAPGVGVVKSTDTGSNLVTELTSFNGATDHLAFPPTQIPTTAAGKSIDPPLVVSVLDANNVVDTNASGSVTLTLASASRLNVSTGTLGGNATQPIIGGLATFSDLSVSANGTYQLSATDTNADSAATSGKFKIGAANLEIRPQPSNTSPGDPIEPGVRVSVVDPAGRVDTAATTTITASLTPVSGAIGTLSGDTTKSTVAGVARFTNLRVNKPGQYVLNFTDSEQDVVTSQPFTISTGKLVFKRRIRNGIPGTALHPSVLVELVDRRGHLLSDVSTVVTLTITGTNSANPITGNSVQLQHGMAVFSDLKFAQPDSYTLSATDDQGDANATSNEFSITGLHLAFKRQPAEAGVGAPLRYKIELEDYRNRLVNTSSVGLGLGLNIVEGGTNAALSSVADTVDFGVAVNSGPTPATINTVGTYTITFTVISEGSDSFDYTINPITSNPFKVVANHLVFKPEPRNTFVNVPLRYVVELEDYRNHVVTTNSDVLNFTLNTVAGGTDAVLASSVDSLQSGIATNSATIPLAVDNPGTFTLTVVDVPANPIDPVAEQVTSRVFKVTRPRS